MHGLAERCALEIYYVALFKSNSIKHNDEANRAERALHARRCDARGEKRKMALRVLRRR